MKAACAAMVVLMALLPLQSLARQRDDILGALSHYKTVAGDNLLDVAQHFEVGYVDIVAANPGIDPWVPGANVDIVLPTAHILPSAQREGIVINLADLRLYWFAPGGKVPRSYPIGVGRLGLTTPVGRTRVVRKRIDPTWYPTAATRADNPSLPEAVPPGPDNPMGSYALDLGWPTYAIHGTNKPDGVGRRVSRGCIRLYPAHIKELFSQVSVGTPVTVVDQAVKLGWRYGELYLEIHPSGVEIDELEDSGRFVARPIPDLADLIREQAGAHAAQLDWQAIERADRQRLGIPVQITWGARGRNASTSR
jgi:L,D-transpeptidase ErfK/SrfK